MEGAGSGEDKDDWGPGATTSVEEKHGIRGANEDRTQDFVEIVDNGNAGVGGAFEAPVRR